MKDKRTGTTKVQTRDPEPSERDPVVENRDPIICVPEVRAYCPKCKSGSIRVRATRPEISRGYIVRYLKCVACGNDRFASKEIIKDAPRFEPIAGIDE